MLRSRPMRFPLAAVTALAVSACADQAPVAPAPSAAPASALSRLNVAPARYLVGLTAGTTELPAAVLAAAGGRVVQRIPQLGIVVLEGVTTPTALGGSGVRFAEPEGIFDAPNAERIPFAPSAAPLGNLVQASAPWYANGVQWDMKAIRAEAGWNASAGAGAKVCIIDSGIDEAHQELAGKVVAATSFVPNDPAAVPDLTKGYSPAPLDSNGHGSHVAGTVAGRGIVAASVAPDASLMTAKVFAATGGTPVGRVVGALAWCADNGAHVVNMSLGGIRYLPGGISPTLEAGYQAYAAGVKYATDRGVVVVTSAGNSNIQLPNPQQITLPAQVPGTIIVGATGPVTKTWAIDGNPDPNVITPVTVPVATAPAWDPTNPAHAWQGPDGKAFYSNFGRGVTVFAPGGRGGLALSYAKRIMLVPGSVANVRTVQGGPYDQIFSVCSSVTSQVGPADVGGAPGPNGSCLGNPGRYVAYAGTSMAAPHVAGMAAVLYAELGGDRSAANRARVMGCIAKTTDNIGPSTTFGGGRVNVAKALAALKAGNC